MENEFLVSYCLFAVSVFCDSTEFEQISLNSESVYTSAVYNVKNTRCDVCVIENNARGVNSHLASPREVHFFWKWSATTLSQTFPAES